MDTAGTLTRRQWLHLGTLFLGVSLFYFWTAASGTFPARPGRDLQFYYNHLQRAFLHGQTSLFVTPPPELLALPDPYDPKTNVRLRMHDGVLFNGKYYLYYGAAPVIALFIPFHVVSGGFDLPEPLAVAIFCSLGLYFSLRLLIFFCRAYVPDTPFWLLMASGLAIGFGNMTPFMLRRPIHYEVAISAGYAFAIASLYYFVAGSLGPRLRRGLLLIGSVCLGFAGGSRFPTFAAGLVGLVLAAYVISQGRDRPWREHVTTLLAYFGPAGVALILLLSYNYVRFGSFGEFGMHYSLQGWQSARTYVFYSWARVPVGFFYYVLVPPRLDPQFPFLFADAAHFLKPPQDYVLEPLAGLLPCVPFLGIVGLAPAFWPTFRRCLPMALVAAAMCVIGAILLLLFCLTAGTMRYEVDFAIYFVVPALLTWCVAISAYRPGDWRRGLLVTAFALTLSATVITGSALSITGATDGLKYGHPETWLFLSDLFSPVRMVIKGLR